MNIEGCPKYKKCSAPICPLDGEVSLRAYVDGEPICFYMREFVRDKTLLGIDSANESNDEAYIYQEIESCFGELLEAGGARFKKRLMRSEHRASKRVLISKSMRRPIICPRGSLRGANTTVGCRP